MQQLPVIAINREFTHDDEYDNHNDTDQPYRFRSRCGKFDLRIDTRRGGRIYSNHISVRCEPTSQYWKGFTKLQYINPQKQFNSLDMAGNNVNAAVFMAYNLNVT